MIDREARNRMAEEIRHFYACLTSNFEFDDTIFEIKTEDRGVIEIRDQLWLTYDDLTKHKMNGDRALTNEQMKVVTRAIVFLKSNYEYSWPKAPWWYKPIRPILWFVTLGAATKKIDRGLKGEGNLDVWPFYNTEEYRNAKENPVYCTKNA